ncbi:MAG: 3-oxoacyl-ACP reductase FabG [bacterium]
MSFDDKVALVTGASRGIGAAIADQLGQQGAFVVGTATSESGAEAISQRFNEKGIKGVGKVLNVCDSDQAQGLVKEISKEYGSPVILVNNAGITRDQLLMRMKDSDWDDIMSTNLKSVFMMSKLCMRGMMKARFGRIISIGSVVGLMGNAGQANYAAAKAGVIGFSKSLAREVGSRGITANVVAPGYIQTDMTDELGEEQKKALNDQIPMGRLGSVEDIAATVTFLASEGAGYITGETISVNGGMYM